MKLYLKEKILSWLDSYNIYDENDNIIYIVKGEISLGHQVRIYDNNYNELGVIKEKILTLLPQFNLLDKYGNEIGTIRKKMTILKPVYELDFNDWQVSGDIFGFNYDILDSNDVVIASISKSVFNISDTYEIDVGDSKDSLLAIMVVLAIDLDKCSSDNS